ncbi:hypothetical protein SLS53_001760 [Cytospora paraplurivora]|uniref:Berberine/berberine-like domain-containing protein n=1 Tax=Cytospora paraplurivora TaxID=2898453 RepID=A0AAN9UJ91_9PEZI
MVDISIYQYHNDLYTVPLPTYGKILVVGNDEAYAVLDAYATWKITTASDTNGTVALVLGLESIFLGLLYAKHVAERPAMCSAFDNITPLVTAVPPTKGTVAHLSSIAGATAYSASARHDYRSIATKIDAQLYNDVYDCWFELATAVKSATGANHTFSPQPVSRELALAGKARGGNALGIPEEGHLWWTTLIDWENEADDDTVRNVSIATTETWKELAEQRWLLITYVYINDTLGDQNPMATYGEANIKKLKDVARRYDPDQVFLTRSSRPSSMMAPL